MRPSVSVVFMVKDEADRIGPSLASVGWADEVLVVDTGSTDATREVARAAGARVERVAWEGYVVTRNRAIALATHDWVLILDADERVSPLLAEAVLRSVETPGGAAGFRMPRLSFLGGRPVRHGTWYPDRKMRLGLRSRNLRAEGGSVHERIAVDGEVRDLAEPLLHEPYRDASDALRKAIAYARLSARDRFEKGRRGGFLSLVLRPPFELFRCFVWKLGFLDGRAGVLVAVYHASAYLLRAVFLIEATEEEKKRERPAGTAEGRSGRGA